MSYTEVFSGAAGRLGAGLLSVILAGCAMPISRTAGLPTQKITAVPEMSEPVAAYNPCNSVGIDARPRADVGPIERNQKIRAGYQYQEHGNWVLFSKPGILAQFGTVGGTALGVAAGSLIGGGTGRAAAMVLGGVVGAVGGDSVAAGSESNKLVDMEACRLYLGPSSAAGRGYSGRTNHIGVDLLGREIGPR